jgi:hypothetical protein
MRLRAWRNWGGWVLVSVVTASLGVAGCGPSYGTVTGKVSYKGVPLKGGNVTFCRSDGRPGGISPIAEDGTYTISKIASGEVTVCVDTRSLERAAKSPARKYTPPEGKEMPGGGSQGMDPEEALRRYTWIPLQYSDPALSPLKYTVKGGSQEYDIELQELK